MVSYKLMSIFWIDAVADSGWDEPKNADDVHHCHSVGFLVKETKLAYVLANSISQKECNGRITIPKDWVRKKRIIKL